MKLLILVYSHSGNNRRLARALAALTGATVAEAVPKGWRTFFSIFRDMSRKRRPAIEPILADPADFDHTLIVAPVWDMGLARPMVTALGLLGDRIGSCSFATLCGYVREGQPEALRTELTGLIGHPPDHLDELFVGDLVAPKDRGRITRVTMRRVSEADMAVFAPRIGEIARRYAG